MKITLIRHGQSVFNASYENSPKIDDVMYTDCGLTELGKEQAKKLEMKFDLLILTPLKRTILTYVNSNIECEKILMKEVFREYRVDHSDFLEGEEFIPETEDQIKIRVMEAINYLKQVKYENVGVICHTDFIYYFMKVNFDKEIRLKNCEYISFDL